MKIDDKDRLIIRELLQDSKQTTHKMSKKLFLPVTTIYNRIKKLEKMGIILNYTVNLNYKKLGRPILAYVGITVDYTAAGRKINQIKVAEQIKDIDGVFEASVMTGGTDILVKILAKDIEDLNEIVTTRMRNVIGVDKTQTTIVLREI